MSTRSPARLVPLLYTAFALGLVGLLLGSIITFVPGHGVGWFCVCGVALGAGLLLKSWAPRGLAASLILVCATFAVWDHKQGLQHQQYLQSRGLADALPR